MDALKVSTTDVKLKPVLRHPRGYAIEDDLFLKAVRGGKHRLVTQILRINTDLDINQTDSHNRTALLISVQLGDYEIRNTLVRLLLKYNADVNISDKEGLSPLMAACQSSEKVDTVRSLIKQPNCTVNLKDHDGNTALNHAVRVDNWRAIRVIVNSKFTKHSVDLWNKDKQGLTPIELAIENGFTESCWILICEASLDTSKISNKHTVKLETISKQFPETYSRAPPNGENNNDTGVIDMELSPRLPRAELNPLSCSPATLTPIDGDLYPRKLAKLPAISNTNHS